MTWRRLLVWLVLVAALVAIGAGGCEELSTTGAGEGAGEPAARDRDRAGSPSVRPGARLDATVERVVDGDTIRVRLSNGGRDTVRYIGIDTPESVKPGAPVECFGRAAAAANRRLVDRERVRLRLDAEPRDRFGRLLAYVHRRRDNLFVNAALVRDGYATILTIPPNVAHAELFRRLQREARAAGRGLWRSC